MTTTESSWRDGIALLRDRHASIPEAVRAALAHPLLPGTAATDVPPALRDALTRGPVVTTGVGSSLAHARYLAWLLRTFAGVPAWDVPIGAFVEAPPTAARDQVLVVFSQGLAPNARFPLAFRDRYRATILVTAADIDDPARAGAAREARDQGVLVVTLPCAREYDVLLRVVGPMIGYVTALRLALAAGASIPVDADAVTRAIIDADARMAALLADVDGRLFAEPITLVGTGGYAALAHNLSCKILEGLFLPWPLAADALELAHGPLQESIGRPRTFLALARHGAHEDALFARVRATLDPDHRWLVAEARLPSPLAIFEHEAMLNRLVLDGIAARGIDQRNWPGKTRDAPLYGISGFADLDGGER